MRNVVMTTSILVLASTGYAAPGPGGPMGPGYHEVVVTTVAGQGEPVESKVLLETPHVKLVSTVLRQGATLAEHSASVQVTIQAISGAGTVKLPGDKTARIEPGKVVVLAPNMAHTVVADAKTDLVLLIHHVKGGGPGAGRGPR